MFEKVNPSHPDKVADRIAGAIVDLGYKKTENPKIAVEVLIGHGMCSFTIESSVDYTLEEITDIVKRITSDKGIVVSGVITKQDEHLAQNQAAEVRCGDNGIFKGMPVSLEEKTLSAIARDLYKEYPYDGKFIIADGNFIFCQSNVATQRLQDGFPGAIVNPLGDWTGGTNVDTGATNRKLGSDMARSVTGGGLHGKDLSKADVSVNIYAWLKPQSIGKPVELYCAIGDKEIDGKPYSEIVDIAREFINKIGGFEAFAEWGLV